VNKIVIATLSHKTEEKLSFLPFSHGWQKFGEKESFKKKKKNGSFLEVAWDPYKSIGLSKIQLKIVASENSIFFMFCIIFNIL
jgi:hypothetical protein